MSKTMDSRQFGNLSFRPPARWGDRTVVAYHEDPYEEFAHSLSISRDPAEGRELEDYAEQQISELNEHLPEFRVLDRSRRVLAAGQAVRLTTTWRNFDSRFLRQIHYFIRHSDEYLIVTGTASIDTIEQLEPEYDRVAESIRIDEEA